MEKYGVDQGERDKTATEAGYKVCPECGRKLRKQEVTGVLLCPACGSKPFEET